MMMKIMGTIMMMKVSTEKAIKIINIYMNK